jgi:hypothetical protein
MTVARFSPTSTEEISVTPISGAAMLAADNRDVAVTSLTHSSVSLLDLRSGSVRSVEVAAVSGLVALAAEKVAVATLGLAPTVVVLDRTTLTVTSTVRLPEQAAAIAFVDEVLLVSLSDAGLITAVDIG